MDKKEDDDLRPMIPLEEEALAVWMMGSIVLLSPTAFLVCTHPRATRVVILDFFESYLEGKVIAIVPPYVRMPHYIAEKTLLLQLLGQEEGETFPDIMSRELDKGDKRTGFRRRHEAPDFHYAGSSARCEVAFQDHNFRGKRLQMLCPATMERDNITGSLLPATLRGRHQLLYQVRVLVNGVAASMFKAILESSVS